MTAPAAPDRLQACLEAVRSRSSLVPQIALILGSGLGGLADEVEDATVIPYSELPGFPVSTAPGHAGRLVMGRLEGQPVTAYQGRVHLYEGYGAHEVAFPVRLSHALGATTLLVTNACGGLEPSWHAGEIMLQSDFINFTGVNPLTGPNDPETGPRFPVLFDPYDEALRETARSVARSLDMTLREGVYLGIAGPAYATRAELRAYRLWGADTIGMSTVLEVIAARHLGMKVLGLSSVTDMAVPERDEHTDEQGVLDQAARTGPQFRRLVRGILARLS